MKREDLRNIAIVAHVDHGKTTLVDALFAQSGIYQAHQAAEDRAMDSMDQERERGITIMAKATSIDYGDLVLQIIDTPGHADFGGEVERTLRMVDGILLLVDAAEGPLPQTRFVLRKAFDLHLPVVVAINKIDRADARAEEVLQEVYDLFIDLGADETQIEFPVLYMVARDGIASTDLNVPGKDLEPLKEILVKTIPAPDDKRVEPFVMQVNQLGYDDYVGRLVVGRVLAGTIKTNETVLLQTEKGPERKRCTGIFRFRGMQRLPLESASCGDIVALAGFDTATVGDTLCTLEHPQQLERIAVDEPTVGMTFQVNDGPLAGRSGGTRLTSRQLRDRLEHEAYANVSITVEDADSADQFRVIGRGELQLSVLIETLRREGFELCVRNPQVVTRQGEQGLEEPVETLVVDVDAQHVGPLNEILGKRKAQMQDQKHEGERMRIEYRIPTRGLLGLRQTIMTATRGTAIMNSIFSGWIPWTGPLAKRANGALVADRPGKTTPYALFNLQPRGELFVPPGTEVYEGMIVGEHTRDNDLRVFACREKKLTNVRASGKDESTVCAPPRQMSLELCLEWIKDDEMVEVTPNAIRLRKVKRTLH
ncbi:MAG: translational GTPase TypA [Myxococcota bacterium]|jgi:GTP-binding protein|nr:translational GTPase TypA [Myxococcota bacterium]